MPNGGYKIIKEHSPKISLTKKGYLKVMLTNSNGVRKGYFMHRLVLITFIGKSDLQVNHIDTNKCNNQTSNLEYVSNRKNKIHSIDKSKTTSKYVGVTYNKRLKKWQAQKMINGKYTYLGIFKSEKRAKKVYEQA